MIGDFYENNKDPWFNGKYKPFGKKLFVKPDIDKPKAGIIIPQNIQQDSVMGEVIASGNKCPANKGDKVIFTKYSPTIVHFDDGEQLYIINSKDLKVIIE